MAHRSSHLFIASTLHTRFLLFLYPLSDATMKIPSVVLLSSSALGAVEAFSAGWKTSSVVSSSSSSTALYAEETRRSWLQSSSSILLGSAILSASSPKTAFAKVATDASSLDADLPPVSFICDFFCDPFCQSAHYCSLLLQHIITRMQ